MKTNLIYKKAVFEDFLLRGDPTKNYGNNGTESLEGFEFADVFVCPHCIKKYNLYTECGVTKEEIACKLQGIPYQGTSFGNQLEEVYCSIKGCNNNNSYDGTLETKKTTLKKTNLIEKQSIEEIVKETNLQFTQGNTNGFNEPMALITIDSGETLEIIKDKNLKLYSMLIYSAKGTPMLPYYHADTVEKLLEEICEY